MSPYLVHSFTFKPSVLQAIRNVYNMEMENVLQTLPRPLSLNGDGRFDSPGHSAMYGLYTLMDATSSKIVVSSHIKVSNFGWHDCHNWVENYVKPRL